MEQGKGQDSQKYGVRLSAGSTNVFPVTETWEYHLSKYYAPKNHNFWYLMGWLATFVLVNQFAHRHLADDELHPQRGGAPSPRSNTSCATSSFGWLLRYLHSTGASAFLHHRLSAHVPRADVRFPTASPGKLLWLIGMAIYLVLMAEGFFGYLLPWGQHVLLGGAGDRLPVRRHSLRRPPT